MPKCPMCTEGQMKFTEILKEGNRIHFVDCFYCGATGEVEQSVVDGFEESKRMWCDCGNPSEDTYYVPDNEHPDISKHHWRCMDCGKVVQIG